MKSVKIAFGVLVVGIIGLLTHGCTTADSTPVEMGQLDSLNMVTLDSTTFQLTASDIRGSLLAVVYNPWCDHCQAQAEEIRDNIGKLEDVTILMIGSVSLKPLTQFSVKYGLNNFKNVKFAYASPVLTYNVLGAYQLPHLRLYDRNLQPIKDFTSTTSVDDILSNVVKPN